MLFILIPNKVLLIIVIFIQEHDTNGLLKDITYINKIVLLFCTTQLYYGSTRYDKLPIQYSLKKLPILTKDF